MKNTSTSKHFETKWVVLIIIMFLMAAFAIVLTYPSKYQVGMSWDEVVALATPEQLQLYGTAIETEGLSPERLEKEVVYSAYDSRAGLYIELNNQKKVIRVKRWKYFGINFAELSKKLPNP